MNPSDPTPTDPAQRARSCCNCNCKSSIRGRNRHETLRNRREARATERLQLRQGPRRHQLVPGVKAPDTHFSGHHSLNSTPSRPPFAFTHSLIPRPLVQPRRRRRRAQHPSAALSRTSPTTAHVRGRIPSTKRPAPPTPSEPPSSPLPTPSAVLPLTPISPRRSTRIRVLARANAAPHLR